MPIHCDQCNIQRVRQQQLLPKALWSSAVHTIFAECNITTAQFYLWASEIPMPTETLLLNVMLMSSPVSKVYSHPSVATIG